MNIAIIPARGGSKRIPRKNIKPFAGVPIIAHSIKAAQQSGVFDRIIVSTDDQEIAEVAYQYGAEIPFFRPKELADDHTPTGAVIEHAYQWISNHDMRPKYICNIYPTAPLIQKQYIREGFDKLSSSDAIYAISVTSMPSPIQRSFKITKEGRLEMFWPEHFYTRSQDLEVAYHDAGQFSWINMEREKQTNAKDKIPFSDISIPIIIPRYLVQDIDTIEDWEMAEKLYYIHQMGPVHERN